MMTGMRNTLFGSFRKYSVSTEYFSLILEMIAIPNRMGVLDIWWEKLAHNGQRERLKIHHMVWWNGRLERHNCATHWKNMARKTTTTATKALKILAVTHIIQLILWYVKLCIVPIRIFSSKYDQFEFGMIKMNLIFEPAWFSCMRVVYSMNIPLCDRKMEKSLLRFFVRCSLLLLKRTTLCWSVHKVSSAPKFVKLNATSEPIDWFSDCSTWSILFRSAQRPLLHNNW